MTQAKRILLIRHTTPNIAKDVCYGSSDIGLTHSYQQEKLNITNKCHDFKPDVVYTSPLKRCYQLAVDLFINQHICIDDRLKEMHFGDWELMRWTDIPADEMDRWSNNFYEVPTPNGESFKELHHRVLEMWHDMIEHEQSNNIAIVTHSGVMRILLMHLMHIPHNKVFHLTLNYGAVIEVKWQDSVMYNVHFR